MTAVIFSERVFFSNKKTKKLRPFCFKQTLLCLCRKKKDVAPVCGKNTEQSVHFYGKDIEQEIKGIKSSTGNMLEKHPENNSN